MNKALKSIKTISVYVLSLLYIIVGVKHFINPDFFIAIVPSYIKWKFEAVIISGFFEIIGGIGVLVHRFRKIAGWGLFALLIAVYPANIYMAITPNAFPDIPVYILYFRLALQLLFFYWAYTVTRESYN